mmetsp:Transcript_328/g.999  ORF Transcript_328/g.999 Transcript_328/m.999 type:complete len:230 (-) Transcript_328:1104-1793(-)
MARRAARGRVPLVVGLRAVRRRDGLQTRRGAHCPSEPCLPRHCRRIWRHRTRRRLRHFVPRGHRDRTNRRIVLGQLAQLVHVTQPRPRRFTQRRPRLTGIRATRRRGGLVVRGAGRAVWELERYSAQRAKLLRRVFPDRVSRGDRAHLEPGRGERLSRHIFEPDKELLVHSLAARERRRRDIALRGRRVVADDARSVHRLPVLVRAAGLLCRLRAGIWELRLVHDAVAS